MGARSSKVHADPQYPCQELPTQVDATTYEAAGCVFTNGDLFLAGYQPLKRIPCISGLGGRKRKGEIPLETAIRETLEELFHVSRIKKSLISDIASLTPLKIHWNGSYVMFLYSFQQLLEILYICKKADLKSPLYATIPLTLNELLLNRKKHSKAEVSSLCLLPIVRHPSHIPFIYPGLLEDMQFFLTFSASHKMPIGGETQ